MSFRSKGEPPSCERACSEEARYNVRLCFPARSASTRAWRRARAARRKAPAGRLEFLRTHGRSLDELAAAAPAVLRRVGGGAGSTPSRWPSAATRCAWSIRCRSTSSGLARPASLSGVPTPARCRSTTRAATPRSARPALPPAGARRSRRSGARRARRRVESARRPRAAATISRFDSRFDGASASRPASALPSTSEGWSTNASW